MIKMDPRIEIIKVIHRKAKEGYRALAKNEFRCSQAVKGARALYHDKTEKDFHYDAENPQEGREYYIDNDGIWHVPHVVGTSVVGTIIHEFIQAGLGHLLLNCEEKVTKETGDITRSGHVDLEYVNEDGIIVIGDIKTTNINVMIWGIRGSNAEKYTARKVKKDAKQGNEYAVMKDVNLYDIFMMCRDDLAFHMSRFMASRDIDKQLEDKLSRVLECVEKRDPPLDCDNALCDLQGREPHYCRHHRDYKGADRSDANCPGRLALAENRKLDDNYE
jgi:hypothetical protein